MDSAQDWVGLIGGILAVLGVVVALTRYLTQLQDRVERQDLIQARQKLDERVADLEARYAQLREQIALADRAGSAVVHQKSQLDAQLRTLMQRYEASGGSIYVPILSPRGEAQGLAFLCIEPLTPETQALRPTITPLQSLAGRCFTSGRSSAVANAAQSPDHFKAADAIANYTPSTTLNIALRDGDKVVGVLQLLRHEGASRFTDTDIERVTRALGPLPEQVAAITRTPDYLRAFGLAGEAEAERGTVLFFDLSRSSLLFQELSSGSALQFLNDYFEKLCEIGIRAGGTVDNYMGDGALMFFDAARPVASPELTAVKVALDMAGTATDLRHYWTDINARLADIQLRCGIATGPLRRATIGHSQAQRLTIVGQPVATAATLCARAPRDRHVVRIDDATHHAVRDRISAKPVSADELGKAASFTTAAWDVTGIG